MSRKLFSTILQETADAPTAEDKVMVLQNNDILMVRQLLLAALDPAIKFDVKVPSYKETSEVDGYSANSLYVEFRRLYVLMEGYKKVTPTRKAVLFAQILESIDKSDAVALIDVVNKDLSKYGITPEIVNEAFPGLLKNTT